MGLENIGDNIEKGADGFDKVTNTIKGNPIVTAIVMMILSFITSVAFMWHASSLVPDAVAKEAERKDAYWQPQVIRLQGGYDSITRVHARDSITIEIQKQEYKMINKKVDSLKNN